MFQSLQRFEDTATRHTLPQNETEPCNPKLDLRPAVHNALRTNPLILERLGTGNRSFSRRRIDRALPNCSTRRCPLHSFLRRHTHVYVDRLAHAPSFDAKRCGSVPVQAFYGQHDRKPLWLRGAVIPLQGTCGGADCSSDLNDHKRQNNDRLRVDHERLCWAQTGRCAVDLE